MKALFCSLLFSPVLSLRFFGLSLFYRQVAGTEAQAFVGALQRDHGVLMGAGYFGGSTVRAMTHLNVDGEGVGRAIDAARAVLANANAAAGDPAR